MLVVDGSDVKGDGCYRADREKLELDSHVNTGLGINRVAQEMWLVP
jgi:hypothetical protein